MSPTYCCNYKPPGNVQGKPAWEIEGEGSGSGETGNGVGSGEGSGAGKGGIGGDEGSGENGGDEVIIFLSTVLCNQRSF